MRNAIDTPLSSNVFRPLELSKPSTPQGYTVQRAPRGNFSELKGTVPLAARQAQAHSGVVDDPTRALGFIILTCVPSFHPW